MNARSLIARKRSRSASTNRYLLDALRACPEEKVLLELKSSLSPCVTRPVEGEKFLYLVLPVRLKADQV